MSKELEALERIGKLKVKGLRVKPTKTIVSDYNDYFIIETALIEKEQQDGVFKILKEIIEFSQMLPHIEPNKDNGFDIMSAVGINIQRDIENKERELLREWVLKTCFPKELKALKIIKEKGIVVQFIKETNSVEQYNAVISGLLLKPLTQEEYKLLKEVLLWMKWSKLTNLMVM